MYTNAKTIAGLSPKELFQEFWELEGEKSRVSRLENTRFQFIGDDSTDGKILVRLFNEDDIATRYSHIEGVENIFQMEDVYIEIRFQTSEPFTDNLMGEERELQHTLLTMETTGAFDEHTIKNTESMFPTLHLKHSNEYLIQDMLETWGDRFTNFITNAHTIHDRNQLLVFKRKQEREIKRLKRTIGRMEEL